MTLHIKNKKYIMFRISSQRGPTTHNSTAPPTFAATKKMAQTILSSQHCQRGRHSWRSRRRRCRRGRQSWRSRRSLIQTGTIQTAHGTRQKMKNKHNNASQAFTEPTLLHQPEGPTQKCLFPKPRGSEKYNICILGDVAVSKQSPKVAEA